MKKGHILILAMIFALVSVSAVSAGFLDGLFAEQDNVIEIANITFNTTNITEFELYNSTEDSGAHWDYYTDENDTGYNINIFNFSIMDDSTFNETLKEYEETAENNSISSQTINKTVIYTTSANSGDHIGETRYVTFVVDNDLKTIVDICSPDANETAKMASTLKFLNK